jgi:AcrR family transcriptional regulator
MKSATLLFLEHGFDATSIAQIAEHSGISTPGIYYHFSSKQALLAAIIHQTLDALEEMRKSITRDIPDAEERLRRTTYDHAVAITREIKFDPTMVVIDGPRALPPEDQKEIAVRKRAHLEFIRDLLEDLKREGKLRDIDTSAAAQTVLGMVAWLVKWYKPKGRLSAERAAEEVTDIVMRSMIRDDRISTSAIGELEAAGHSRKA